MADSTTQLISQPLQSTSSFNFVFLIEWITIGILTVWFLFYFNRVLATIISYALRLYTWHKLGVYVDIEALQISLLAGRIFFKGVHYHGDNETIHIHGGYITWRYWLRKVKQCDIFEPDIGPGGSKRTPGSPDRHSSGSSNGDIEDNGRSAARRHLPCRIEVKVSGVEAFIYNRGPGYDYILDNIGKHEAFVKCSPGSSPSKHSSASCPRTATTDDPRQSVDDADSSTLGQKSSAHANGSARAATDSKANPPAKSTSTAPPSFLGLLPISVECNRAAAVLGNENTPSIITAKIDGAAGEFDAGAAGELDIFKILMNFDVRKPVIQMKPNIDYKRPQLAEASILKQTANPTGQIDKQTSKFSRRGIYGPLRLNFGWTRYIGLSKKASASLESVVNLAQISTQDEKLPDATQEAVPGQARWLGLTRYLEDEQHDERDEWDGVEYAKSSTIAELDAVTFKMFWDVPGYRPIQDGDPQPASPPIRDINGSVPPDYGMEIAVYGGKVSYGPWADRHRLVLQQIFFPAGFTDMHPTPRVKPGEARINSTFNLLLRIEGDTVLRVPFREPSRDWRWKGRADAVTGKTKTGQEGGKTRSRKKGRRSRPEKSGQATDARPYAWFDIKVLADSTVSYSMDQYPYPDGYRNELNVDVKGLEMFSSLNHALLWRSQGVSLKAQLPYTLAWNGLREWVFEIGIKNLDLFLLRDHTFLLVDLIEDWTTGPPPSFFTFVPYRYILKTHFDNFNMFLNVNDANIVDNSDDLDDNDFVVLHGRTLDADLTIPIDRFRPAQSEIKFDVVSHDLGFDLSMPPKNTLNALLLNKNVAKLPSVVLKGTYGMYTEVRPGLTDTLRMEIIGTGLRVAFYGFFARHLAKIKENYFGDTIHFRTNEEFQDLLAKDGVDPHGPMQTSTKSNDLDVILDIVANDAVILVPAGLYSCDEFIDLRVERADVDLRVNNYYLELAVDSSPLRVGHNNQILALNEFEASKSGPEIVIDGVNVFGHRLFGLSPSEPAYVSNWDIDAGDILGDMTCEFLAKVVSGAQALALTLTDEENGLPLPDVDPIYDMTAVRFQCSLVRLWLRVADVAFLANVSNVAGTFHDRNTAHFSQQLDISVPDIHVACTENEIVTRDKGFTARPTKDAHAFFQTSVSLQMLQRSPNFDYNRQSQHEHIARHDVKGHRAQFLLPEDIRSGPKEPSSVCLPPLPGPLHGDATTRAWAREHPDTLLSADSSSEQNATSATRPPTEEDLCKPFASGSIYDKPSLPLDAIRIDLDDVPAMPKSSTTRPPAQLLVADSLFNGNIDDDATHTSLIIHTQPGVVAMCKPKAVQAVSDILESVVSKDPAAIFDMYHMSAVQEVISLLTRKRGKKTILDVSLKVPFLHARVINPFIGNDGQMVADEYNFTCSQVSTMVRVKNTPDQKNETGFKAVHLTSRSLGLYAQKRIKNVRDLPVAFRTGLDDLLLWVADSDRTSIRATFRILEALFSGTDVQYLASLVHRTTILADTLQAPFASLAVKNDQRRRYLIYHLTRLGEGVSDPSFLTRPSYMIRSAKDHLRNSDTWKIIARLRWVMMSLPKEERDDLKMHCLHDDLELPEDAEVSILAALDHWRAWDAIHIKESIAMRLLFNSGVGAAKLQDRSTIPVAVVLQATLISVKIDHGTKQNEVSLDGMALALSITPPPPPSAMQIFHEYEESRIIAVQVNTTRASMNLKWEVCELIDSIMMLFQDEAPGQQTHNLTATKSQPPLRNEESAKKEEFHIVFAADTADINIETINIAQKLASSDLKISVTGQHTPEDTLALSVNTIASARAASMTMLKESRTVWASGITKPAFFLSFVSSPSDDQLINTFHVAGDCDELHFDLKEDILGVLETVNLLIDDEARYVKGMVEKYGKPSKPTSSAATPPQNFKAVFRANLALFLKRYYFRVSIHPNLHYLAEGRIVRIALNPDVAHQDKYRADFDLKGQSHHILSGRVDRPDTTSTLNMPPINGTLRLSIAPEEVSVWAMVTMEQINFEGASVYGIAAAMATPAAITAFEAIKGDVETVGLTAKNVFALPKKSVETQPQPLDRTTRNVTFKTSFVLAGFTLSASSPSKSPGQAPAEVVLSLGATRFRAANRSSSGEHILPFPELSLTLGDIDVDIRRGDLKSGSANLAVQLKCTMDHVGQGAFKQNVELTAVGPVVSIDATTAPTIVDILAHFQDLLKGLDLSRENKYLRRLRHPEGSDLIQSTLGSTPVDSSSSPKPPKFTTSFTFDIQGIQVVYEVGKSSPGIGASPSEDLAFTLKSINLLARSEREARLKINGLQLQFVEASQSKTKRSANSALLPELVFNVTHERVKSGRHLTFRAAGKALDLQLDPNIVKPINGLKRSLDVSVGETRRAVRTLRSSPSTGGVSIQKNTSLGKTRISYVFVDTNFAGAVIRLQGAKQPLHDGKSRAHNVNGQSHEGRFGQFLSDSSSTSATLRVPGIALRVRYEDVADADSSLNVEVRVDGSNNTLTPSVVPLVLQAFHNVKETMQDSDAEKEKKALSSPTQPGDEPKSDSEPSDQHQAHTGPQSLVGEDALVQANPQAVLGRTRLNVGLRICKQEFSMTCQPIAKVAAKAKLDDIYIAVNTVESSENGNFFAVSVAISGLRASLQHVYSREATFVFDIESIILSMMNSKHISGTTGISAILRINPMKAQLNAKQLQDMLLFREIWLPPEIRSSAAAYQASAASTDPNDYFVKRYRQIAASTAFPWNATIAFADLAVEVDLGQAIGKLSSRITDLWASSKKTTKAQQTLCFGVEKISIDGSGRTSGFVQLNKVKVRTSIAWPTELEEFETPLVQGSIGFQELRLKAAFDYQAFAIAHITNFEFIMYNVRDSEQRSGDRLVAILDGDKINVYCVAASAALAVSLVQALDRLVQEKKASYDQSLKDIETFLRRKSAAVPSPAAIQKTPVDSTPREDIAGSKMPISLQTDVVVTLGSVNVGAFPRTIIDNQLLKLEAVNVQARFAVALDEDKIHSGLGLTLGQVSAALASTPQQTAPSALIDITVEQVVRNAALARGGVILRVPRVVAAMQTWQASDDKGIDYTFKSLFEGKIDVGWNYSRISFIRSMWETHCRTLASRLGRPLPESAVKIRGAPAAPEPPDGKREGQKQDEEQQKITAVVNLPQSKYIYRALEPPIIDTPQLRDMGEATPPLEWIGLHRDRLPNVTHQVVIVTLLEVAKEVEDAYSRILGSAS